MNLYDQANIDNKVILEDSVAGFGREMTLTNPDGVIQQITGMAADIGNVIDPETGQNITQRAAHVTLHLNSLTIGTPVGVPDETSDPWLVEVTLPGAVLPEVFKVFETAPDRLGCIVCFLTQWNPTVE